MHTFERTYGVQPLHMGEAELRLVVGDDPEGARAAVSPHLERVSFAEAAQPVRAWASVVVTRAAPMLIDADEIVFVTLARSPGRSTERTRIFTRRGGAPPLSHSTSMRRAGSRRPG